MAKTKEEKIARLKEGIASPSTPADIKEEMKSMLAELERPEPEPAPVVHAPEPRAPKADKKKPYNIDKLPHVVYFKENNVEKTKANLGLTLYNLYGSICYAAKNGKGDFIAQSNRYVERVKKHLEGKTPPPASQEPPLAAPVPDPEPTEEEQEATLAAARDGKARRAKKVEDEEDEQTLADAKARKEARKQKMK